jgi:hypothetical protein
MWPHGSTPSKDAPSDSAPIYDTRKPYIDAAKHDPAKPGTRTLSAADKTAAVDAMVPKPGAGGAPAVFTRVTPDGKDYGDEIRDALTGLIKTFHKDLYEDKVGLRADPAKNMHDWSVMEGPPKASKQVTDALYASNYGGAAAFPAMTHAGGNLIDQWTDEESRNSLLTDPQKKAQAREKVVYPINSNCDAVNAKHGAVPSSPAEKAILDPIVDSFVSDKPKIQTMLDLDIGWGRRAAGGCRLSAALQEPGRGQEQGEGREPRADVGPVPDLHPRVHPYARTSDLSDMGAELRHRW